jgi:hypothetical protein
MDPDTWRSMSSMKKGCQEKKSSASTGGREDFLSQRPDQIFVSPAFHELSDSASQPVERGVLTFP